MNTFSGRVLGPVLMLALLLVTIFFFWLVAAHTIWAVTLGPARYDSLTDFANAALSTTAGWTMILVGIGVGFVFAAFVLCISLVSFPMLIDRPVGVPMALATSLSVARHNPRTTAVWGLIVAFLLLLAILPLFTGLILVLPVLGHATWHLYRRAVSYPVR